MSRQSLMNLYIVAGLSAALFSLFSCSGKDKQNEEIIIHGKLKNSLSEKVVLQQLKTDSIKPLDSVTVDENGEFTFKFKPQDISFYLLKISNDNFITLLADKGEQIELRANARQMAQQYTVSGSPGSELVCQLNDHTRMNFQKTDSLYKLQILYQDSANFPQKKKQLDSLYEVVIENQRQFVQDFIRKNKTSLASLMAIYQIFGRQKVLNERDHFAYFNLLDSTLSLIYPKNGYVLDLHTRVQDVRSAQVEREKNLARLDSGMVAPDIQMKNIGGNQQNLSALKGRYTLILFWAASSKPSVDVLEPFKWMSKKYRDKGFQVYAVSLDTERRTWEYTVREKKPNWINVSDLLGWDSPVVKDYCLDNIPLAVLIDNDGRIMKRGITTDELPMWLYKIYKF